MLPPHATESGPSLPLWYAPVVPAKQIWFRPNLDQKNKQKASSRQLPLKNRIFERAREDSNLQPSDSKSATLSNWATGAKIRKFLKYNNFPHGLSTLSRRDFVSITKKCRFGVSLPYFYYCDPKGMFRVRAPAFVCRQISYFFTDFFCPTLWDCDFQRQYSLKPRRCPFMTVSGFTMIQIWLPVRPYLRDPRPKYPILVLEFRPFDCSLLDIQLLAKSQIF